MKKKVFFGPEQEAEPYPKTAFTVSGEVLAFQTAMKSKALLFGIISQTHV